MCCMRTKYYEAPHIFIGELAAYGVPLPGLGVLLVLNQFHGSHAQRDIVSVFGLDNCCLCSCVLKFMSRSIKWHVYNACDSGVRAIWVLFVQSLEQKYIRTHYWGISLSWSLAEVSHIMRSFIRCQTYHDCGWERHVRQTCIRQQFLFVLESRYTTRCSPLFLLRGTLFCSSSHALCW